ncbi:MAG: hypothetical protein NVSMB44_46410 [Ktedonobacteraceae bacterium]
MRSHEQESNNPQVETMAAAQAVSGQLEAIFNAMADGVFVYDGSGHLIKSNATGRGLLDSGELYRSLSTLLQEGAERFHLRNLQRQYITKAEWPISRLLRGEEFKGKNALDVLVPDLNGQERLLSLSGAPIRDLHGRLAGGVIIVRDITEHQRMQEARSRSEEVQREAPERAEVQPDERTLHEANQTMDEFIGIASHELRTPLTTVKASVQLAKRQLSRVLKQDMPHAEAQHQLILVQGHLERTERQIAVQNRLISDLLDVSRIHANRLEFHPDLYDLTTLVREVIEGQRYLAPERTLQLTGIDQGQILVRVDADRVRQVIDNYLSNALKYSDASKSVAIDIEVSGMQARVSVRDQGPGLSVEQQKHVWERFYRVPGVKVKTGSSVGLGLGLHISRMIIERQRGQIGVESMQGQGSTFWFTLPLAEPM